MEFSLFELLTYFIIYSFLGWVMESIVRSVSERKIINTGFLIGPFCPIYGIGAIIMLLFLDNYENKPVIMFFISIIILTIWEYIVGVLLEKIFKTKYWDYSDQKFNFQGRICLVNSLCWGVLGIIFVKFIHPFVQNFVSQVDITLLKYIISVIVIVFLVDMIISIVKVKKIRATLDKVEELNKQIKEKLKELTMLAKDKQKSTAAENIQTLIDELNKKKNKTIIHLYKNVYRLKKAFPAINTKEITEVLNKKINEIKAEMKKKK